MIFIVIFYQAVILPIKKYFIRLVIVHNFCSISDLTVLKLNKLKLKNGYTIFFFCNYYIPTNLIIFLITNVLPLRPSTIQC